MSDLPRTPSKQKLLATSPNAFTSSAKVDTVAKAILTPHNDTKDASTYTSAVGSILPATPLRNPTHDMTAGITSSLRAAQIDPAIKAISSSPKSPHEVTTPAHHSNKQRSTNAYQNVSTPSSVNARDDMAHQKSTNSSPSDAHPISHIQKWRDGNVYGADRTQQEEDPFLTSSAEHRPVISTPEKSLALHPSKIGMTPTNNTAQAMFSPQACVFVANLTQSETDEQLEQAVTQAFQQFGNVYVKIRRDGRQMPFAFAQYTNVEDAQRAISLGRGLLINGRPCRTEVARVNRSLYLSKINGGAISETEARNIMDGHGPIEMLWFATHTEREMFGLPEGIFVRFAFFDDCRDAVAGFRDSGHYRLEQVKGLEEARSTPGRGAQGFTSPFRRDSPGRLVSPFSARRAADAKSIFVGNVPPHLSDDQLVGMFQMYGRISNVEIIRKPSLVNTSGVNAFAFIEFDQAHSATLAVQAGPRVYQDLHLRVEHKDPSTLASRSGHNYNGSPLRKGLLESQEVVAAFQRGVSVGMSQAAQAQLIPPPFYPQYQYYPTYDAGLQPTHGLPSSNTDSPTTNAPGFSGSYVSAYSSGAPQYGNYGQGQQYLSTNASNTPYQWPSTNYDEYGVPYVNNSQELQ